MSVNKIKHKSKKSVAKENIMNVSLSYNHVTGNIPVAAVCLKKLKLKIKKKPQTLYLE